MKKPTAKSAKYTLLVILAAFIAIQAVPYGRDHNNPPVVREPDWNTPETRALAKRACFDCHSNETVWPWYSFVAPISWLVYSDVKEGRTELNFSDWRDGRREGEKASEIRKQIDEGEMPPLQYRLVHAEARLTVEEKRLLIEGLTATTMRKGSNHAMLPNRQARK